MSGAGGWVNQKGWLGVRFFGGGVLGGFEVGGCCVLAVRVGRGDNLLAYCGKNDGGSVRQGCYCNEKTVMLH